MTAVKICGIRRREDIEYINKIKPEYIGYIFAKSKRQIDGETAKMLNENLDKGILKVGVFVNSELDKLLETAEKASLDIIQLHGEEDFDYIERIPEKYEIWKAIRVKNKDDIDTAHKYNSLKKIDGILLDAYSEKAYGGMGETFDWNLIKEASFKKLILAGGLNSENITDAILKSNPDVVDVSSGVETDGFKDFEKIRKLMEKVRNYDED
jgi:phosphoribosylanthranilate isomerase